MSAPSSKQLAEALEQARSALVRAPTVEWLGAQYQAADRRLDVDPDLSPTDRALAVGGDAEYQAALEVLNKVSDINDALKALVAQLSAGERP